MARPPPPTPIPTPTLMIFEGQHLPPKNEISVEGEFNGEKD